MYWGGKQKKRITLVGETISSVLKPLEQSTESRFEVSIENGPHGKCSLMKRPYCCDFFEVEDLFRAQHGAGRKLPRVMGTSVYA